MVTLYYRSCETVVIIMATFQTRQTRGGKKKIKAIARIRLNGKQINRTRTFEDWSEAKSWAADTESLLKAEKVREIYGILPDPNSLEDHVPNVKVEMPEQPSAGTTLGEVISQHLQLLTPIQRHLSDVRLAFINTSTLIGYFMARSQERASRNDIEAESVVLRELVSQQETGSKRANIVSLAFEAACADGAEFGSN